MSPRPMTLTTFAAVSLLCASAGAQDAGAQDALRQDPVAKMQAVYEATDAFRAEFKQVYSPKGLPHKKKSKGTVSFKKPGLMRWDYADPKKLFVADGTDLYFFQPEEKQVLVTPGINAELSSALSFLFGKGELRKDFDVTVVDPKKSRYGTAKDVILRLVPKVDEGQVQDIHFVVDPKSFMVRETVVVDPMGNKNHIRFSKIELNPTVDPKLFTFEVPPGVEVIRPPQPAAPPR